MSAPAPNGERRRLLDGKWESCLRWRKQRPGLADVLPTRVVLLALAIVASSVLDALFTLLHLAQGAREVNPVMHLVLEAGVPAFVAAKTGITGLGVGFLAAYQNLRLSFVALHCIALMYGVLLSYHGFLFWR